MESGTLQPLVVALSLVPACLFDAPRLLPGWS
jgi:hypothetical protein